MIVKVKSKYGSLVAVRDKYIKKCKKEFDDNYKYNITMNYNDNDYEYKNSFLKK